MFDAVTTLYLSVETPLHAGVGSGLSAIDLPIQRERTTQYPMIQGSGIKGKLRGLAQEHNLADWEVIFGPEPKGAHEYAGALVVGDARILLFPVRSLAGVFAYVTSADVLQRFKRDFERDGTHKAWTVPIPEVKQHDQVVLTAPSRVSPDGKTVVLEEFSYLVSPDAAQREALGKIAGWLAQHALPTTSYGYWQDRIKETLVLLPENDFRDFALYSTEIITRVRLKRETKTVEDGALWTEEHLPTDTLLYAPVYASASRKDGVTLSAAEALTRVKQLGNGYLQLGGDETVGRGIVRVSWE